MIKILSTTWYTLVTHLNLSKNFVKSVFKANVYIVYNTFILTAC